MRLMRLKFVQDDIWIDGEDDFGNYQNQCIYNDIEYIDDEMYDFKKAARKIAIYQSKVDAEIKEKHQKKLKKQREYQARRRQIEMEKKEKERQAQILMESSRLECERMHKDYEALQKHIKDMQTISKSCALTSFAFSCMKHKIDNSDSSLLIFKWYGYTPTMELYHPDYYIYITTNYISMKLRYLYDYTKKRYKKIFNRDLDISCKEFKYLITLSSRLFRADIATKGYICLDRNMAKELLDNGIKLIGDDENDG